MKLRLTALAALVAVIGAAAVPHAGARAQDAKKAAPNPVGIGSNWSSSVTKDGDGGVELDKKQMDLIQKVNAYFRDLPDLKGNFIQTAADNKRSRGKFFVKRPGRFRFDYASPSKLVIISDGDYLRVQDYDLNNEEQYSIDQTPFRVLLRKDVDLVRDAKILDLQEVDDVIVVTLQDKSPDTVGKIKLFLGKKPNIELKEWVTTDAQGLDTRIELQDLAKTEDLDPGLFKAMPIGLRKLQ
ncbi:MAG: outer-membrane lipoprotein carrier protein LolA [Hyphomicrobiaceae bacterium]|nr:outer-membrane lipoprotein carrier protein LolA [Hyphomicrobiaceae bacterium]